MSKVRHDQHPKIVVNPSCQQRDHSSDDDLKSEPREKRACKIEFGCSKAITLFKFWGS